MMNASHLPELPCGILRWSSTDLDPSPCCMLTLSLPKPTFFRFSSLRERCTHFVCKESSVLHNTRWPEGGLWPGSWYSSTNGQQRFQQRVRLTAMTVWVITCAYCFEQMVVWHHPFRQQNRIHWVQDRGNCREDAGGGARGRCSGPLYHGRLHGRKESAGREMWVMMQSWCLSLQFGSRLNLFVLICPSFVLSWILTALFVF